MPAMEPIDALQKVVAEHGLEWVFEQPETVETLMQDYCQQRKPQIRFLVDALKEQIPQRLLSAQKQVQRESAVGQARAQLQANLGMQPEKAAWTVDAWLRILNNRGGAAEKQAPTQLNEKPRETRVAIRKSKPKTTAGWQQAAGIGLAVLAVIFVAYELFVKILPKAWTFVQFAWTMALAGSYAPAILVLLMCVCIIGLVSRFPKIY